MIEFYGKLSSYVARAAERMRRRYYARYLAALAALCALCALIAGLQSGLRGWLIPLIAGLQSGLRGWLIPLIAALVLAGVTVALWLWPVKDPPRSAVRVTVDADAGTLTVVQQVGGKEVKKQRPLRKVRRVYKGRFCYVVVLTDLGSAVICERNLLRKGSCEFFEYIFAKQLREKEICK